MKIVSNVLNISKLIKSIDIIIVTVTYNVEGLISELIKSIAMQNYNLKSVLLIIVDNNSYDRTVYCALRTLRSYATSGLNYVLIKLNKNLGFTSANNIALSLLRKYSRLNNKIIILLNPDTKILDPNFLAVVKVLLKKLYIVGFSTISGDFRDIVDSVGAYIDYLGNAQDILFQTKIKNVKAILKHLPMLYITPLACFAAIAIEGDVLEDIGLLRNDYVIGFEDAEFCLRAWSKGIPIVMFRDFLIWHKRGASIVKVRKDKELDVSYHTMKNLLLLAYEYLGLVKFILRIISYIILGIVYKSNKYLVPIIEVIKIIKRKALKHKRLPKGLIPRNPRTWVLLWALKYLLNYGGDINTAISYGVRRASIEYVLHYLIPKYWFRQRA